MTDEKRSIINKDELKDAARRNFLSVLNALEIPVKKQGWCLCPNPSHNDRHATNARINVGGNWDGSVKCFACGYFADAYSLVKDLKGLNTDPEIWEFLSPEIGQEVVYSDGTKFVPSKSKPKKTESERLRDSLSRDDNLSDYQWKDYRNYYLTCHKNLSSEKGKAGREYLHKRGLSDQIIDSLKIGYDYSFKAPRVIIPITKSFYLARDIRPSLSKEQERFSKIKPKGEKIAIFNPGALNQAKPVFIVEGEFDAISIMEMGYPAISLGGVANTTALERLLLLKSERGDSLPPLILALDADEAGQKAAKKFIRETKVLGLLDWGRNAHYCNLDAVHHVDYIYTDCKDANELLCKDRELFGRILDGASKRAEEALKATA